MQGPGKDKEIDISTNGVNEGAASVARAGTDRLSRVYFRDACPRKLPTLLKSEDDLLLE